MTPQAAQRTVIGLMVLTGIIASLGDVIYRGQTLPRLRIYIGALFAAVTLSFVSDGAPTVAASFAWLIFIGVLLAPIGPSSSTPLVVDVFKSLTGTVGG